MHAMMGGWVRSSSCCYAGNLTDLAQSTLLASRGRSPPPTHTHTCGASETTPGRTTSVPPRASRSLLAHDGTVWYGELWNGWVIA
jgi:hypothetical protein